MTRFIIRRVLLGILVLWLISVVVFALFFVAPHDPARLIAGRRASALQVAEIRHHLGLDQPVLVQYWHFLVNLLHGNLGYSYYSSEPVTTLLQQRLPITASLAIGGAIIWVLLGVATGILAARRPRSWFDRSATVFVLTGLSMPTFLIGILLLYFLFFRLHLAGVSAFPGGGYVPITENPAAWAQHMILPWLTLAFASAATYTRLTRTSMLGVLGEDYVRTARAKGISERRVMYRHALRSALTPIVTQLGVDLGTLLGGAIVTEYVFGLPGLGELGVTSVTTQDLPVIVGLVIVAAAFIIIANIIVDILYGVLDPRVRVS